MVREIKFVANAVRWFDKVNGNTYHSVRIENVKTGETLKSLPMVYGYDDAYRQTALKLMADNNWLPEKYLQKGAKNSTLYHLFERENNYPIIWHVSDGLKREMKWNVE